MQSFLKNNNGIKFTIKWRNFIKKRNYIYHQEISMETQMWANDVLSQAVTYCDNGLRQQMHSHRAKEAFFLCRGRLFADTNHDGRWRLT